MKSMNSVGETEKKYVDELREQLKHLNEINSNTKKFVEKMVKVIPEKEYTKINGDFIDFQNLHLKVEKEIAEYESLISNELGIKEPSNQVKVFTNLHLIHDDLAAAFTLLNSIFNFIRSQNYMALYTENMSQTFISGVKYDITQIETAINNYFLYNSKIGKAKITELCHLLSSRLTDAAEEYINQPLTPNLITSMVAQNLIKMGRKHHVLEKLELLKQNSLFNAETNANLPETSKFNFKLNSAAQLSRFNLVPSGEFMPLAAYIGKTDTPASANWKIIPTVIKAMKNAVILGANEASAKAFAKMARFHGENHLFILNGGGYSANAVENNAVENNAVRVNAVENNAVENNNNTAENKQTSFIEFNILPLIDANYIKQHEMQTAEKSGLNNRIIRRFETIKEHTSSGKPLPIKEQQNTAAITPNEDNSEVMNTTVSSKPNLLTNSSPNLQQIVEIMWLGGDNFLYRKLTQLDSKGNNPSDKKYTPNKVRENNLLEFAASSRPHLYNKIIENKVIAAINPKHREVMEKYMNEPIFIPPKQELHEFIKTTAEKTFDNLFNAYNSRDKMTNMQKLRKFYEINIDEFAKIVEPAVLQYYSFNPLDNDSHKSIAMQTEANLSLIVILDLLCDKFSIHIRKNIEKMMHTIDKNLFITYNKEDEIKSQIKGYFLKVITDTFNALDAKPSLWEEIEPQLKMFYF